MKIYTLDDRIKISIHDAIIHIAPLSFKQKMELQEVIKNSPSEGTLLAIRNGVKGVEGFMKTKDTPYSLSFEDGMLTEECANDLLNIKVGDIIASICVSLIQGIPEEILDPSTNKPLEGVEIINP
jgi:hypothetical protein